MSRTYPDCMDSGPGWPVIADVLLRQEPDEEEEDEERDDGKKDKDDDDEHDGYSE